MIDIVFSNEIIYFKAVVGYFRSLENVIYGYSEKSEGMINESKMLCNSILVRGCYFHISFMLNR